MVTGLDLGRRVRAARELAGLKSADQLAKRIGEHGLSARTLRNIEGGRVDYRPDRDLWAIANACDLPLAWFQIESIGDAIAAATTVSSAEQTAAAQAAAEHVERAGQPPDGKERRNGADRRNQDDAN